MYPKTNEEYINIYVITWNKTIREAQVKTWEKIGNHIEKNNKPTKRFTRKYVKALNTRNLNRLKQSGNNKLNKRFTGNMLRL